MNVPNIVDTKRIVEIFDSSEEDNVEELPNEQVDDNNVRMEDAPGNDNGNNQDPIFLFPPSNNAGGVVDGMISTINPNDNMNNFLAAMPNTNGSALSFGAQNNQGGASGMNSNGTNTQKVKMFRCRICSKWYTHRGSLVRHFKDKHKDQMV